MAHVLDDTDAHSTTPLDLLLNAISGSSAHYPYPDDGPQEDGQEDGQEGLEGEQIALGGLFAREVRNEMKGKRTREDEEEDPTRRSKIAKILTEQIVFSTHPSGSSTDETAQAGQNTMSTVKVWHPKTGQKSYGKERRILNPPPTLRITGPLLSLLTTVTLCSTAISSPGPSPPELSSQTHHIPLIPTIEEQDTPTPVDPGVKPRKSEKGDRIRKIRESAARSGFGASLPSERQKVVAKEREVLMDGLSFPGLWVGEAIGKAKEFQLELRLGQPGTEIMQAITVETVQKANVETDGPVSNIEGDSFMGQITPADLEGIDHDDTSAFVMDPDSTLDQHLQPHASRDVEKSLEALGQAVPADPIADTLQTPWATLASAPVSLVTKPSQKTAKARSMSTCLTEKDTVSLFVRINSQNVRTKYMKLEKGDVPLLTCRTGKWSPFRLEVVHRATVPLAQARTTGNDRWKDDETKDVLTYGSVVVIVDAQSGARSEAVQLVKVERKEAIVDADAGHPVSELQRVGFAKVDNGGDNQGGRWYLSAPGARAGGGELLQPGEVMRRQRKPRKSRQAPEADPTVVPDTLGELDQPNVELPEAVSMQQQDPSADTTTQDTKRLKTRRHALAQATLAEEDEGWAGSTLRWAQATSEIKNVAVGGKATMTQIAVVEKVEDWMCWIITGVSCFSYSFFEGDELDFGPASTPLDPIPRVLTDPVFHPRSHTLDILLSNFDPSTSDFDIFLGPIGPLHYTLWRSTAPSEPLIKPGYLGVGYPALCLYGDVVSVNERQITSLWPCTVAHTIVVVELPTTNAIVRVMQSLTPANTVEDQPQKEPVRIRDDAPDVSMDHSWMTDAANENHHLDHPGELTIQEALENAENALEMTEGIDLDTLAAAQAQAEMIDPTLGPGPSDPPTVDSNSHKKVTEELPCVSVTIPEEEEIKFDLVPLLFLMIRRSDGVGFGVGSKMVAERPVGQDVDDQWSLKVVPT